MNKPKTKKGPQTEELTVLATNVGTSGARVDVLQMSARHDIQTSSPDYGGNGGREIKIPIANGPDSGTVSIWSWGVNNLLPNEREALLMDNNLVPELIATKMALVQGSARFFFERSWAEGKEVITEVNPPEWWLGLEQRTKSEIHMSFDEVFDVVTKNLFIHANAPIEFIRNKEGKIHTIEPWECINSRCGKQNSKGFVEDWYWCGNWRFYRTKSADYPVMWSPAYNYSDSNAKATPSRQAKFVLQVLDQLFFDGYYAIPGYWGGRKWISSQNKIPIFHDSNIDDGYNIKLHCEFPKDYFMDYTAMQQATTAEAKNSVKNKESEARQEFIKKMNQLFSKADGHKIIFTEYEINKQIGKDFPGVKIKVLEPSKLDESLLKLFDKGNDAVVGGQGIPAVLASIQQPGKLSSGSEALNLFNIYITIKAPRYRRMISKIFDTVRQIEAPDSKVEMGFRDIELATLDVAPTGMVQPDPNAGN